MVFDNYFGDVLLILQEMKHKLIIHIFLGIFFFLSCSSDIGPVENTETEETEEIEEWLIPYQDIKEGGPGKDGIPSLDNPIILGGNRYYDLPDDETVIIVRLFDEIRVYPISILNWHEIINDQQATSYFTLTYSPLTGTSLAWDRKIADEVTTFGISGLLYNNNMIAYDRNTDSHWQQMLGLCVNGQRIGRELRLLPVVETNWKSAKQLREFNILQRPSGYGFDYDFDPYKFYPIDHEYILFPPEELDNRFAAKEKLFVIFANERIKAFPVKQFSDGLHILSENFNGTNYVLIGDQSRNLVTAYLIPQGRVFVKVEDRFPIVMEDNLGNLYNFMGVIEEGPNKGMALDQPKSYLSYWFSLSSFFNRMTIFE